MIAVISYDAPHRKTQDLVTKLILNGYSQIHIVAIPFIARKNFKSIFQHRPTNKVDVSVEKLCERLNINYSKVEIKDLNSFFKKNTFKYIMIAGAGILPNDLVSQHKIINSHPGYLPKVKGLDALKWAIFLGEPVGVTVHYIDSHADEGILIDRRIIPIYFEDTFHNLAYRVYETEIEMLVNSIDIIENNKATYEPLKDDKYIARKRMPHRLEIIMMSKFEEIRKNSPSREE
jgi:phosphoribosylglycinamide formyltransferase-1